MDMKTHITCAFDIYVMKFLNGVFSIIGKIIEYDHGNCNTNPTIN
jgi:hypothetical protein